MAFVRRNKRDKSPPDTLELPVSGPLEVKESPDEIVPEENYQNSIIVGGKETDTRTLPKPKGIALTFDGIMEYLGSLTPEHWEHCIAYVYRLFPEIDRKLVSIDAKSNIDKLSGPITSQEFVAKHGGGKYKILVNDLDKEKSRSVCRSTFEISWTRFLPIINYDELMVNSDKNKAYLNFLVNKGILNGDYSVNEPNKSNVTDMIGFMTKMLDRMDNSNRQVIETIRQSANAGNSDAINVMRLMGEERDKREALMIDMMKEGRGGMEQFEQMLALLKELKPAETGMNGQIQIFQQMLSMQAENHKQQMELMAQLAGKKEETEKEAPKSLKDQILELKELGDVLGMGGGKKNTLEVVLDKVGDILEKGVPLIVPFLMQKYGGGGATTLPVPMPTPGNHPTPTAQPQPVAIAEADYDNLANQFIQQYGQMIIGQLDMGITGDEAAESLITVMGGNREPYLQIKAIGKDRIINAAKANAAFWQRACLAVDGEENVIEFINDFFDPPNKEDDKEVIQ